MMQTRYKLDRSAHAVFSMYYHLIFVTKYRRKALYNDEIRERLKQIILDLSPKLGVEIVVQEPADDHIHIVMKGTLTTDLVKVINTFKGVSSRYLRQEFPETKKYLWGDSFWSDSKFVATTGQVSLDVLKQYVESQGEGIEETEATTESPALYRLSDNSKFLPQKCHNFIKKPN